MAVSCCMSVCTASVFLDVLGRGCAQAAKGADAYQTEKVVQLILVKRVSEKLEY